MNLRLTLVLIFTALLVLSCKKDAPSLQQYIIESKEKENFMSLDLSTSMINSYLANADDNTKEIAKTLKKINLVGLPIKGNEQQYEREKEKLSNVFKNNKNYKLLMKIKKENIKLNLYYTGETENIKEVIVFGYSNNFGLGVARLLGENIKPEKIIEVIKETEMPKQD